MNYRLLKPVGLLISAFLLVGCLETEPLTQAASRGLQPASGPARISVLNDAVSIRGPAGYCIDTEATRESDIEAFALLVRCRGTLNPAPVLSATVTGVPAPDSNDPNALRQLAEFLASAPGRAQLSRSGDPRDVTIRSLRVADRAIWILVHDTGNPSSFDPTYWRAVLPIAGRIVTLSVLAAQEHPMDVESGLSVLRGFVMRMRAANAAH